VYIDQMELGIGKSGKGEYIPRQILRKIQRSRPDKYHFLFHIRSLR
jgi:hypothetical protein